MIDIVLVRVALFISMIVMGILLKSFQKAQATKVKPIPKSTKSLDTVNNEVSNIAISLIVYKLFEYITIDTIDEYNSTTPMEVIGKLTNEEDPARMGLLAESFAAIGPGLLVDFQYYHGDRDNCISFIGHIANVYLEGIVTKILMYSEEASGLNASSLDDVGTRVIADRDHFIRSKIVLDVAEDKRKLNPFVKDVLN